MTISPMDDPIPRWTVGDRLRKARERTGLDRNSFAAELGISRNSVTKYEAEDKPPRSIVLKAWAMKCGVPARWLETGEGNAPGPEGTPSVSTCSEPGGVIVALDGYRESPNRPISVAA